MVRSMMSGISGLKNHQVAMDVIGNNIANVNTTGFKASRVTFCEVFSNTMANATAPNNDTGIGGTNPMQVGMGAGLASIDMLYTSGNIERTDNPLDVSIDGSGLFIVKQSDLSGYTFTRAGAFGIDKEGNLVTSNGSLLCGWTRKTVSEGAIEADGFDSTMDAEPINVFVDKYNGDKRIIQPQPTTDVEFSGNLNANSETGTIINIPMTLYDNYGYEVQANMKLVKDENLSKSNTIDKSKGGPFVDDLTPGTYVKPRYQENVIYSTAGSGGYYAVPADFADSVVYTSQGYKKNDIVNKKYVIPDGYDTANIQETDDTNLIGTDVGGTFYVPTGSKGNLITVSDPEAKGYTEGQWTKGYFVIPDGTLPIDIAKVNDGITDSIPAGYRGYLKIESEKELIGYDEVSPDTTGALRVINDEREITINTWTYSITVNNEPVNDALGNPISGKVTFGNGDEGAEDYGEVITVKDSNGVEIPDFKLALNVNYDNKPDNVAEVKFNFAALTQYAAKDSADVFKSNGYPTGNLQEYSIGNDGVITGIYSNGKQQALGMIALAYFDNPEGLKSIGDSSYAQTANSGDFRTVVPGEEGGSLTANTLEMSNVDLSTEFTNMIVYQRGFQANSRIITTADEMLQELVSLKR